MKPRNREINIFNLSMLDVISGAMGAFLIIMVILLPYYNKETIDYKRELEQSRDAEKAAQAAQREAEQTARSAQAEAEQNRRRADEAARQLAKTFLLLNFA